MSVAMAGAEGLEPSRTVLETGMLPLHHAPMVFSWPSFEQNGRKRLPKVSVDIIIYTENSVNKYCQKLQGNL